MVEMRPCDDLGLRCIAVQLLEEDGYTVFSAGDGEEVLQIFEAFEGPLDLLLTDVVLPKLGGRQVAEAVQRGRPDVRVLFMTGYTEDKVLEESLRTGNPGFLRKPFKAERLLSCVRDVLDSRVGDSTIPRPSGAPTSSVPGVDPPLVVRPFDQRLKVGFGVVALPRPPWSKAACPDWRCSSTCAPRRSCRSPGLPSAA